MDGLIQHPTSVGGLVKKIIAVNPNLGVPEIIKIVREATRTELDNREGFGSTLIVDENRALELARALLKPGH